MSSFEFALASCCNGTQPNDSLFCSPSRRLVLFGVISTMLVISLSWNIFCCVSKCRSGKGTCRRLSKSRMSPRHMEDNPIYGNINYMGTRVEPPQSSLRDQQRVTSDSQSKPQDCYANLTLKPPRPQSGRSSPQIQYSDVVQLDVAVPPESEKEDDGNTDGVSIMSDLYASVQTQQTKKVNTADTGEDYANHL